MGCAGTTALPDRDGECLAGSFHQICSSICRGYQQATVTGDSDLYYKGKVLAEPGMPNAFLTRASDYVDPAFRAAAISAGAASIFVSGPPGWAIASAAAIRCNSGFRCARIQVQLRWDSVGYSRC